MKRRLLAVLLAVAMLATSFIALPVFAANADLSMANGARTYYAFDQAYTGTVTLDFDLNIGSGSRFNMWLESTGQAGYESSGNPWLQSTGEGALYLQDAVKVGNIIHGQDNHFKVVVDLAAKTFTVAINNGAACEPVAFTGDMADIAGFDYRMQNTAGTVTNITVTGAAPVVPDLSMANGARTYYAFDQAYTGTVTLDFDLNIGAGSRFNMWLESTGQAGYESSGNPWLQFVAEGDLYLQDAVKVGSIIHGQYNHFKVVVDLTAKTFTVAINNGEPCAPQAFTGDMADIAGFDYRMQNTAGSIDNLVVSAAAAPVPDPTPSTGSEDLGTTEVAMNKDSQIDFSKGYTGTVKVSFDLTLSAVSDAAGSYGTDMYLPIQGSDRTGTAKPYLQITKEGGLYAQGETRVGSITADTATSIVWEYNCETGSYTVAVGGGAASAAVDCGKQDNVGALAYKTRLRSATIANLKVEGEVSGGGSATPDEITEFYVGPDREYKTLAAVLALLTDGDTVYVDGGYDYPERVTIRTPNVTIKGIGNEKPNFNPSVTSMVNGIFVLEADGIVLENLKITGDVYRDHDDPDWGNTSHDGKEEDGRIFRGVFNAGDGIVIRNCDVSHCAQGIQSNNDLAGSLTIEYSNIHENGRGWGEHNLYLATNNTKYPEATLVAQYNYIHDANCDSNGLKTRALNNKVYYNWFENNSQEMEIISMGNDEATLRQYESSNDVVGNVFVKTMDGRFQGQLCRIGGDGTGAGSFGRYRFANNTFAFLRSDVDWNYNTIRLHMGIESVEMYNNVFYAPNVPADWPIEVVCTLSPNWASGERLVYGSHNWVSAGSIIPEEWENTIEGTDPGFVDVDNLDFHLFATSPLVGAGTTETVKTWDAWTNGNYSNKNTQIADPLDAAYEPIHKDAILGAANTVPTPVARVEESVSIGAYGPVVVENYVGASIVGEETVEYPNDVVYDVVLSEVEGLNVLTLAAKYDPAVLTYKSIAPVYEELEEFSLDVDEDEGVIKALYLIKNEMITAEEASEFVTLTFTSVEPGEEGVDATVELTHLTASGLPDGEHSVQYNTFIEVDEATTKIVPAEASDINVVCVGEIDYTVSGSVVTVDHEIACKVGYLSGGKYVAIAATPNGDGTYSFTAPEGVTEVLLVITGDANANGELDAGDCTRAKAALLGKVTLSAEAMFAGEVNGTGELDAGDCTRIKATLLGKTTLEW